MGFTANLPWQAFVSSNVYYGSGFSNGTPPPNYLPGHTSVDLSLGKEFRDKYSISVTALNAGNRHLLIDNSLTFGGFHYNDPREIYAEFRWRFHYYLRIRSRTMRQRHIIRKVILTHAI